MPVVQVKDSVVGTRVDAPVFQGSKFDSLKPFSSGTNIRPGRRRRCATARCRSPLPEENSLHPTVHSATSDTASVTHLSLVMDPSKQMQSSFVRMKADFSPLFDQTSGLVQWSPDGRYMATAVGQRLVVRDATQCHDIIKVNNRVVLEL